MDYPLFSVLSVSSVVQGFPEFGVLKGTEMKVLASVKKICRNCKIIRRKRVVRVICTDPRHKQRQG